MLLLQILDSKVVLLVEMLDLVFSCQLALVLIGSFAGNAIFPPSTSASEADKGAAVVGRLVPIETRRINGCFPLMKEDFGLVASLPPH